ncbi:hypothetical protein B1R94_09255 [Mycolicibacterium litorale]|nr:hypothetical protein B1R94_09255 [Mycolicibacterium litorale]
MSVEYIRYRIDPARHDEFLDAYRAAGVVLADSDVCLRYELAQCEEETDRFILRISWTSTADHLTRFRGSQGFQRFFALVAPFVGDIEEMQHYREVLSAVGAARPPELRSD